MRRVRKVDTRPTLALLTWLLTEAFGVDKGDEVEAQRDVVILVALKALDLE